jgi:cold-inducible RNA-binding protein
VFVGNLNFSTTQTELETLFGQVGAVTEVFLPIDRATGQPRGFAFVEFSDSSSIAAAISRFDGTELQGRALKVNEARERAPRAPGGGGGGGGFGPPSDDGQRFKPAKPKGSRRGLRGRKRGF